METIALTCDDCSSSFRLVLHHPVVLPLSGWQTKIEMLLMDSDILNYTPHNNSIKNLNIIQWLYNQIETTLTAKMGGPIPVIA
jgi:hypothetical protein